MKKLMATLGLLAFAFAGSALAGEATYTAGMTGVT
tara:strand:- start:53995 stop:54099 length:105 start_codon:yes stop_codon:yes gene_type:complete